jgi:hypothetical protein
VLRLADGSTPEDDEFRALIRTRNHRALFAWSLGRVIEWVELPDPWKAFFDQHRPVGRQASLYSWVHGSEERTRMFNMLLGPRRLKRAAETLWPSKEFLDEWGINHRGNLRRLFSDAAAAAGPRR